MSSLQPAKRSNSLRADELSVHDGPASGLERGIWAAHWLKSKCRRTCDCRTGLPARGPSYESETMLQSKRLLHEKGSPPRLQQEIERLVRRFVDCRTGTYRKANQLLQHMERSWLYPG